MISRGYYIGAIVDEFATIADKISMRNRLGLFDLTVHAETYFSVVMNLVCGWKLQNLNADRSNEPGLDLGDAVAKIGVQVTSNATSAKVNDTLKALTKEQRELYTTRIIVLVVGKKQSSYTLDGKLRSGLSFSTKDIWDLNTLARKALRLDIETLQELYTYINKEAVRVRVELEVPDQQGKYPTDGYAQWEVQAKPKIGNGDSFVRFASKVRGEPLEHVDEKSLREAIVTTAKELKRLPRVTREFLVVLIERREEGESYRRKHWIGTWNVLEKLIREYQGRDIKSELELLDRAGFTYVDADDVNEYGSPEVFVRVSANDDLAGSFLDFLQAKKLDLRQVIGRVDLSAF